MPFKMAACPKLRAPNRTVKVSPRGATRLKAGHVWVYRSDIVSADGVAPGSLVAVTDHRGKPSAPLSTPALRRSRSA